MPDVQTTQTNWHYIDCNTGNVVAYAHGTGITAGSYAGGCFVPTQNRIYMAPSVTLVPAANWHYIDCNTGNVVAYTHGVTVVNNAYFGAAYSSRTDRVFFVPAFQSGQTTWHFIDCNTGSKALSYTPVILR
jgi:hypothetical protein